MCCDTIIFDSIKSTVSSIAFLNFGFSPTGICSCVPIVLMYL